MGWLSGTPKWFDMLKSEGKVIPPAPKSPMLNELESMRINCNLTHEEFVSLYRLCWWHQESMIRASYVAFKRMRPDIQENILVVSVFAPIAQSRIGFWYKDQDEVTHAALKLKALQDVINELKMMHHSSLERMLHPSHKPLVAKMESILEKYGHRSMKELFQTFDDSLENK